MGAAAWDRNRSGKKGPGAETAAESGSEGRETRMYPSGHRALPSRNRICPGVHRAGSGSARPGSPHVTSGLAPPPPLLSINGGPTRSTRGATIATRTSLINAASLSFSPSCHPHSVPLGWPQCRPLSGCPRAA